MLQTSSGRPAIKAGDGSLQWSFHMYVYLNSGAIYLLYEGSAY
jgi:hypothetical protein